MRKLISLLFVMLPLSACASSIAGTASMAGTSVATGTSGTQLPSGGQSSSGTQLPSLAPTPTPTSAPTASQPSNSPSSQAGPAPYRTVDPCSFFTKSAFNGLGHKVNLTIASADYSSCSLSVIVTATNPKDDQAWSVYLDMGGSYAQPSEYKTRYSIPVQSSQSDGTQIVAGSDPSAGCLRGFALPDSTSVVILAKPVNDSTKGDPCPAAVAGLNSALHSFRTDELNQLQLTPGSIAGIDPCAVFAAAVSQVVGNRNGKQVGEHGCQWRSQQNSASVTLESTSWPPPLLTGGSAQSFTLNGHEVQYGGGATGSHSLVEAYLDMGASPVGLQGSHDAISLTILNFVHSDPARQQVTKFFTTSWQSLPQH